MTLLAARTAWTLFSASRACVFAGFRRNSMLVSSRSNLASTVSNDRAPRWTWDRNPQTDSVVPPFRRENRANPKWRKAVTTEVRSSEAVIGAADASELRTEEVVCEEYFKIESP